MAIDAQEQSGRPLHRRAVWNLRSLVTEVRQLQWMVDPLAALRLMGIITASWLALEMQGFDNILDPLLRISYPLPMKEGDYGVQRYGKGPKDMLFLAFYVLVFSFIRQVSLQCVIPFVAKRWGISKGRKLERFNEQGYAFMYWSASSLVGLIVMSKQPTWWYDTKAFWIDYPHWRMRPELKAYYLLQFAYWLQQLLVMVLRLEKPRSDYLEYCLHHAVTLWLIGWSYALNLTYIGTAIFFSMDIADVFLAVSKMLNYLQLQRTSECSFVFFLIIWTYFRHYQNIRILFSVWYEYDIYLPQAARVFDPLRGIAMSWWMKYQVFLPIFALQLLNLFWYALMWRIILRMLSGSNATDTREEDEDFDETHPASGTKSE